MGIKEKKILEPNKIKHFDKMDHCIKNIQEIQHFFAIPKNLLQINNYILKIKMKFGFKSVN